MPIDKTRFIIFFYDKVSDNSNTDNFRFSGSNFRLLCEQGCGRSEIFNRYSMYHCLETLPEIIKRHQDKRQKCKTEDCVKSNNWQLKIFFINSRCYNYLCNFPIKNKLKIPLRETKLWLGHRPKLIYAKKYRLCLVHIFLNMNAVNHFHKCIVG